MGISDLFGKGDTVQTTDTDPPEENVERVRKIKATIFWMVETKPPTIYDVVDSYDTEGCFFELRFDKNGSRDKRLIFPANQIHHVELVWVDAIRTVKLA